MKLRLNSILRSAILAAMSVFSFSGASLLAADPIEGFNSPLLGYWGNSFGGAAWGRHLTLNDSFAARGYSGVTYGGAVFSFGGSGDIVGGYGRYEMVDGKEKYVTYGISLGGSLTLTGSHYSFVNNSAKKQGGAIHAGDILFSDCSSVLFDSNSTPLEGTNSTGGAGGAIYSSGYVLFDDCNHITFKNNSARYGAVAVADTLHFDHCGSITVENNISQFAVISVANGNGALKIDACSGDVVFRNNVTTSSGSGGAVVSGGFICMNNTGKILFEGNSSAYSGGVATNGISNSHILYGNQDVAFSKNYSGGSGGVFASAALEITHNKKIEFRENSASTGGAISDLYGKLSILENNEILFIGNIAWGENNQSGGAVAATDFQVSGNKYLLCLENKALAGWGGAFMAYSSGSLLMNNNDKLEFLSNSAGQEGGAIFGGQVRIVDNNGYLRFSDNKANSGGAISGTIELSRNGQIYFSDNSAVFQGGAIKGTMEIEGNEKVLFENNSAKVGGAIYSSGGLISIADNNYVGFIGNCATEDSSAIHSVNTWSTPKLRIENNGWVEFLDNQQGIGAYAVHAQDLVVQGNDYVIFHGNICGLASFKSVIDTKVGSSDSAIHFFDAFAINNNYSICAEFNPTGDGTILLSSPTAQCEVKYAANLGGGTMEWKNYAHLTVGSNYTVGTDTKGASLIFRQSGRTDTMRSLTVGDNLTLKANSDITFYLDKACERTSEHSFVQVGDWLVIDPTVNITVEASSEVLKNRTHIPLISVSKGIEYNGVQYAYSAKGWTFSNASGEQTIPSIDALFFMSFQNEDCLTWIDNTLYYTEGKVSGIYKVARFLEGKTWRGDQFYVYDANKNRVYKKSKDIDDTSSLCWFCSGCNIIQYWQDEYAPLYQSDYLEGTENRRDVNLKKFLRYYINYTDVNNTGGNLRDVLSPWFMGEFYRQYYQDTQIFKKDGIVENSPWRILFGEENFKYKSFKFGEGVTNTEVSNALNDIFLQSGSALFLGIDLYDDSENLSSHAVTVWKTKIENDNLTIWYTDSDYDKASQDKMQIKIGQDGNCYIESYSLNNQLRNFYMKMTYRKIMLDGFYYMTTPAGMDEMLEDYYSGKNDLEWTGRGKTWSAKGDSEVRLANVDDGFKIACSGAGKTVYAHKYFTNGERANFVFGEKVGEVAVANKRVVVERDMSIGTAKVTGKGYVFEGNGTAPTLNALNLTVGSGADLKMQQMSLSTNVLDVRGTLDVWDGNASTKVDAAIVDMGWQGKLICGGMSLEQTDEATAETVQIGLTHYCVAHGLSELNVGELTGNGTLGCYIDFGGAEVTSTDSLLSQSDSLNKAFYDMLNLSGDVDDYKYSYIGTNLTYKLDATQEYETGICLNNSAVVFALEAGEESLAHTIGSHGNAAANAEADISISETMGGTVEAPDTALSTVSGADVRLGSNTSITAASLTISEGSTLYSDGEINLTQNSGAIQVSNGAELGGSGTFGATVVNSGGVLRAGGMQGGARYNGLTLEAGATLVLSAEAMSTPLARSASGVSLTLTGDLKVAEGAVVQVACGLDFLNNCNAGEVLTFNAVKLSGTADSELTDLLNGVTEFVFRDEDDSLAALSTVGAYVHHVDWQSGADDTLQLSFVLTAASEDSLVWTNAGGDGVWSTSALNWQNPEGETVAFTADANVLICDGGTVTLEGCLTPGNVVISTPEAVTLGGGGALSGSGSLTKEGSGELYLSTNNEDFAGVINLCGGNTYVECEGALGSAQVNLDNAALHLGGGVTSAGVIVSGQSTLSGADALTHLGVNEAAELTVEGGFTVGEDVLFATDGAATYIGDLTLSGGVISIGGLLTLEGNLTFTEGCTTTLDLLNSEVARYGSYELMLVNGAVEGYHDGALVLQNAEGSTILYDAESGKLVLHFNPDLTWQGGKKAVWQVGAAGWTDDGVYEDGKTILFNGKGTVTIVGEVAPGNMTVDITKSLTIKQNKNSPEEYPAWLF